MSKAEHAARIRRYAKTPAGFLQYRYNRMSLRVRGLVPKSKGYDGLPIISRQEFIAWAGTQEDFYRLFEAWEKSGYERRLTPTVDRIEGPKGYVLGNMRWLTLSENCRLGALQRWRRA